MFNLLDWRSSLSFDSVFAVGDLPFVGSFEPNRGQIARPALTAHSRVPFRYPEEYSDIVARKFLEHQYV